MSHRNGKALALVPLLVLALIAGCTSLQAREGEPTARERYWYYAGDPISSFNYFGRISGFTSLGRDEVVIFTRINEAYLLKTDGSCFSLGTTSTIGLESRFGSSISNFDTLRAGRDVCRITQIRPINYKQMKQDERELREERAASGS